jgi:Ni/Co efflux regulator RcnB
MKKFILAALAASVMSGSMLAAPAMAAPYDNHGNDRGRIEQRHDDRRPTQVKIVKKVQVQKVQYRNWKRGDRFDYRQARNYRVISAPRAHHLRDAPRGYRWVQSGNDAVLIGITSGVIASIIAGALN